MNNSINIIYMRLCKRMIKNSPNLGIEKDRNLSYLLIVKTNNKYFGLILNKFSVKLILFFFISKILFNLNIKVGINFS